MTLASPCSGSTDNNGTDALMPARVFNHVFGVETRRRRQAAGHAFLLQQRQSRFDFGPVRSCRIGQHFQLGLHAPAQRGTHLEQALDR